MNKNTERKIEALTLLRLQFTKEDWVAITKELEEVEITKGHNECALNFDEFTSSISNQIKFKKHQLEK